MNVYVIYVMSLDVFDGIKGVYFDSVEAEKAAAAFKAASTSHEHYYVEQTLLYGAPKRNPPGTVKFYPER